MKLEFLWDEEKIRQLHKFQLLTYFLATIFALIYGISLPAGVGGKEATILIPAIAVPIFLFNYLSLPQPHQGVRSLFTTIFAQIAASIYMASTEGFSSVIQFAPYVFLFTTVFQLGSTAALILAAVSVMSFLYVLFAQLILNPLPTTIPNGIFYIATYILATMIIKNVGHEISLQFQARRKLEQVDDLKNQFITLTSHYLRTPLTVTKSLLSKLNFLVTDQTQNHLIKEIKTSVGNLDFIVEKFLLISSIEKGLINISPALGDINQLIISAVDEYKAKALEQKINLIYQPPTIPVEKFKFDSLKIKEVLLSLIDNGIKFNKPGGKVTVVLTSQMGKIRVDVADNGIGISKDHLETLFSVFNRGKMENTLTFNRPGMGLSLYLVKLIVEAHEGKIEASSKEGTGSTFSIVLPRKHD